MIHIAAKLNYKNLNEEVLKHFARLQSKDEQVGSDFVGGHIGISVWLMCHVLRLRAGFLTTN